MTLYGWEDIEWGSRLRNAGVPLIFDPDARALHHHQITLESSLKRMEVLGESAVKMEKLLPGFDRLPRGWKRIAYEAAAMLRRWPENTGKPSSKESQLHIKNIARSIVQLLYCSQAKT